MIAIIPKTLPTLDLLSKSRNLLLFISLISCFSAYSQKTGTPIMDWEIITEIPSGNSDSHPGFAGTFAGISNERMIIAGGANFPNGMPWEGGTKSWSDDIFVLRKEEGVYMWNAKTFKLPHRIAYGASLSIDDGLLCIGGQDSSKTYNDVFVLQWDIGNKEIITKNYPALPVALAHTTASIINNIVYVAAGESNGETTNHFFSLDLSQKDSKDWKWQELPKVPGRSRAFSVLVSQANGFEHGLYLFSGRCYEKGEEVEIISDGYFFSPQEQKWKSLDPNLDFPIMAGNGFEAGLEFVVLASGADGKEFLELISLENAIKEFEENQDFLNAKTLKIELNDRLVNHRGFSRNVLSFNTITKSIVKIAELPYGVVTAPLVKWDNEFYIVSGEVSPGVRTPSIMNNPAAELTGYRAYRH